MHTKWMRGGLFVLALVAVLGLVLVACHKKEGAEQSKVIAAPAAPAQMASASTVAAPQVQAPAAPSPASAPVLPARVSRPAPHKAPTLSPERASAHLVAPEGTKGLRAPDRPVSPPVMSLPDRPLTQPQGYRVNPKTGGLDPLPAPDFGMVDRFNPNLVNLGPIEGDTVVVEDLPPADPPSFDRIHRVRVHHEPIPETTEVTPEEGRNIQDASAPDTAPASLVGDNDTRAPIAPGTPAVSQLDWDAANTDGVPFDVDMAAGTDYIITDVNTRFHIYNKSGVLQNGAAGTTYRSFFNTVGTPNCGAAETATNFLADPQVSYDDENNRWVMTILRATVTTGGAPVSSYLCLACSQTSDPRGAWNKYEISDGAGLADYPHTGIGEDAIFIGANHFGTSGAYDNAEFYAIQKSAAYAGTTISPVKYNAGAAIFTPQPAERRGFNQGQYPPSGTPHYFVVRAAAGTAGVWRWPQPTFTSTPSSWGAFAIAGTTPTDITGTNITTSTIDGGDTRPMDAELRWPYLWYTRGALANTRAAIEWGGADVSGGSLSIVQSGTYGDGTLGFFWPDCTVDRNNNFAIGFTAAANTGSVFPAAYVTGRENGITPNNTLEAYQISKAGEVKYNSWEATSSAWRWGDYAGMAVDPNGCDIWFHGQYTANTGTAGSVPYTRTWLRKYKFPSCSVANNLALNKSRYTCTDTMVLTVDDSTAVTAAQLAAAVAVTTSTDTEHITAANWTDLSAGAGTKWQGSLTVSSTSGAGNDNGILNVTDGGTVTATYTDPHGGHPAPVKTAPIDCSGDLQDGGFIIAGGCDNGTGGEKYTNYMDRNELSAYTFGIFNNELFDLTDARVTLSASGAGASAITIYNPTVNLGTITSKTVSGAVFNIGVNGTVAGMTPVVLTASVTSPADGLTTPFTLAQTQYLHSDDTIVTLQDCSTHQNGEATWSESALAGGPVTNPWSFQTTAGETRTDAGYYGLVCGNASGQSYQTGNMANTTTNFSAQAFSALRHIFQPANRGNAPNGQPWNVYYRAHTFYSALETAGNTQGIWGVFYDPEWNNSTAPTGDQVDGFPYSLAYYYHTALGWTGEVPPNDWEAANTGTPDDPVGANQPPNQWVISLGFGPFPATASSYFAVGHEHADFYWFNGGTATTTRRDVALDNNKIIYDEFYTSAQTTTCAVGTQPGEISWDKYTYGDCGTTTATLTVLDSNAVAPFTATVTSAGGGDSETVTFSGSAPHFTGTILLGTGGGVGANNGTLFVLPTDTLTATYTDTNPAATTTSLANYSCTAAGDVVYESNAQVSDNGDNDGFADNNETVVMDITIHNNMASALTNAQVQIVSMSSNVDCITDSTALYGTVAAGASATNPASDRFTFHVNSAVACSNWQAPPTVTFTVLITGDGFSGSSALQTFTLPLDLDAATGSYTLTQPFNTDPGWTTGATADDDGACTTTTYSNNFLYRPDGHAAGNGCYGAWRGTGGTIGASGTTTGYGTYDSSTLYSPLLTANGNVTLQFNVAYKITATYHGAKVQAKVGSGAWTNVGFTTPAQAATTTNTTYCSPMKNAATTDNVWSSGTTGVNWTATNTATVTATGGQTIQFRWRLGSDSTAGGAAATGGLGVDDVVIGGLRQTYQCEPTRNTGLPGCPTGPVIIYDSHGTITPVDANGNGVMEAGEKYSVSVTLKNVGIASAANVQASLTGMAAGDGIVACDNPQSYGTIPVGGTASATFTFVVNPATFYSKYACPTTLTFNVVSKSTTTPSCTCIDELGVFSNAVGLAGPAPETRTQQTTPLNATNSTANSTLGPAAFTITTPATTSTLSYSSSYSIGSLPFTDEFPNNNNWTVGAGTVNNTTANASTCGGNPSTNSLELTGISNVYRDFNVSGYTNVTLTVDHWSNSNLDGGERLTADYSTNGGASWTTMFQGVDGGSGTWTCGQTYNSFPAATTLRIRFSQNASAANETDQIDHFSLTGTPPSRSWINNARVSLVDPSSTVTVLKAYGAADPSMPVNVAPYYTGPGTYTLRLEENAGGTATITAGSMTVTKAGTCGTWTATCVACAAPNSLTNNGAADLNALADTGVQVTWAQDAGNWGDGGSGTRTYDVLRDGAPIQSSIAYGTTTYTDTTGVNGTSYVYSVRYNNGCGQNAATAGASATDWVDPGETAATSGLLWQSGSKSQLNWAANSGAVFYNLYRGVKADLPNLLTASNDSCTRYTGATASATGLSETNGSAGDFYWYLVTGINGGGGEGTAGNATAGPRIVNSTGTCP